MSRRPHGLLVVDKPKGVTSARAVRVVQRTLGLRKGVGHTGTLDPMATGVLPVCVGEATKLSAYLMEKPKTYEATALLGITTDTLDAEGEVQEERALEPGDPKLEAAFMGEVVASFLGEQSQTPPMFSALKKDGVRLHKLARQGETVERKARQIRVYDIEATQLEAPTFAFRVRCSQGTYVRVLAADMGERIGYGAHLTALRRTEAGGFTLDEAMTPEEIEALGAQGLAARLLPLGELLRRSLPCVTLDDAAAQAIRHGRKPPAPPELVTQAEAPLALFDAAGAPLAIGVVSGEVLEVRRGFSPEALADSGPQRGD